MLEREKIQMAWNGALFMCIPHHQIERSTVVDFDIVKPVAI